QHAGQKEEVFKNSVRVFIKEDLAIDPKYNSEKFDFNELGQAIENALLFEEYHGNKQIRDYCSSMITRFKSVKERDDFSFLTRNTDDINQDEFLDSFIGVD